MMGKEIDVRQNRENQSYSNMRKMLESHIELPPDSCHVASDRAIHETGEQRNISNAEYGIFRVSPRTDRIGGFKDLHACGKDVKDDHNSTFSKALQSEYDE